ncbi:MAG: SprT family zinc-dependent metalloprotease [Candidatus Caldatribacteriota bacterium]|nr:SprT family zinc-dependent metalloprotease [Candidatus Caldatribacteriota bacterium]
MMEIKKIIRSNRKTIALQVCDDTNLIVRAPFKVSEEIIDRVILKHINWIEKKKKEMQLRDMRFPKKKYVNGEGFLYLGNYYRLRLVENQEVPLNFENGFILSKKYLSQAKDIFIGWYKKKAYEKISERVEWYAQKRGLIYNKIKITSAQKRWGSCSCRNNLNFPWRLIMAPLPVVDYVIIHELVHFGEKNHSRRFWNKVKMLMPNYKEHQNWLKKNGHLLRL